MKRFFPPQNGEENGPYCMCCYRGNLSFKVGPVGFIELSKGKGFALVDAADFDICTQFRWRVRKSIRTSYAYAWVRLKDGKSMSVSLHHFVFPDLPLSQIIDHKNRDGLDCRKRNLRPATQSQNMHNLGFHSRNTSGYKGVSLCKKTGRWRASIKVQYKCLNLGRYDTPQEAAKAYSDAANHYGFYSLPSLL